MLRWSKWSGMDASQPNIPAWERTGEQWDHAASGREKAHFPEARIGLVVPVAKGPGTEHHRSFQDVLDVNGIFKKVYPSILNKTT